MGVLDRLDDLWDAGFEIGRTSVNTAIDIVEAPFTDDEYEGLIGTLSGITMNRIADDFGEAAGWFRKLGAETLVNLFGPEGVVGTMIGAVPEPVRDVGRHTIEGLEWSYREGVAEPITAVMSMASLAESRGTGAFFGDDPGVFFDRDNWRWAYQVAQDRSPGQAIALAMRTDDILDEEQVAHWEGTAFYNIMSGTWDAAFRIFAAPEVAVFGAGMVGRALHKKKAFEQFFLDGQGFGRFADDVQRLANEAGQLTDEMAEALRGLGVDDLKASQKDTQRLLDNARRKKKRRKGDDHPDIDAEIEDLIGTRDGYRDAAELRKAADKEQEVGALHDLAGRIREKYFPKHGDGDLVAYELARSFLGLHGFTGGRASMENVMKFFMGETSVIGRIADDSGEAAGWFRKLFADTATVADTLPPGTPGAAAAQFDQAQRLAADLSIYDILELDPSKFAGFATIDEAVKPGLRRNLVESMDHSSWYRPDGDAARPLRYLGRTIRVFRDMKPQRTAWVGDANSGEQVARVLQEAGYSADEITRFRGEWASTGRLGRVGLATRVQEDAVKRLVKKHFPDIDKSDLDELVADFAKSNMSARKVLMDDSVMFDADTGLSGVKIVDPDTGDLVVQHIPLTPAQLKQTIATLDAKALDKFLAAKASKHGTALKNVTDTTSDVLGLVMQWWRPGMLLRPAWAIRVVGDEQLRMFAKLGTMTRIKELMGTNRAEYVDAVLRRKLAALGGEGAKLTSRQLMTRRAALTGGIGGVVAGVPGAAVGVGASLWRNNRNIKRLTERTVRINAARATRGTPAEASGLAALDDLDMGNLDIMGFDVQGHFGDALAPQIVWRKANSANRQAGYLLLNEERKFADDIAVELGGWTKVHDPTEARKAADIEEFGLWWERVVNDHYGGNTVGRIAFDDSLGTKDDRVRALVEWIESPDGADFAKGIEKRLTNEGTEGWAGQVVNAADRMLNDPALRAKIAGGKRVRFADLQRSAADDGVDWRDLVGNVHAQEASMTSKSALTQRVQRVVDNLYERIGTLTTDNLSRNPYFENVYKTEMTRRIAAFQLGDGSYALTDDALRAMEQSARRKALQEVRDLLYDLAESSQFSDMMRNVMPFFNAWQEVLTRWAGLAVENPVFAARMAQAFRADIQIGDWFQTVETDDGERFFQFRIPEFATGLFKHGIVGDAFDDAGMLRFRADSINMVTQGLPGFGPLVQIPASKLVTAQPELEDAFRFLLPYGPVDPLQSMQPAWMKRITSTLSEDRSYQSFAAGLMLTRLADMSNGDIEPIDFDDGDAVARFIDDIKGDAKRFMYLRGLASAFSPAAVNFHSPYQLWIDRYRELKSDDPKTADDKFMAELAAEGNEGFFALAARFSKNNEGLPATIESERTRNKYLDLIRQHPEVGGLILGIEGGGAPKFSAAVYEKQLLEDTSPGSGVKRRERMSLQEVLTSVKEREGWQAYGLMNDAIYNEMRRRGLPNLQVADAADLQAARKALIVSLSEKHPLWFEDYKNPNLSKWRNRFEGIRAVIADERLAGRDDVRLLSEYMKVRDIFTGELARRSQLPGGTQSIDTRGNKDLLAAWESIIETMLENPTFSELLWRWLEYDPLVKETWPESQRETVRLVA